MKILTLYIGYRQGGCYKRLCMMMQASLDAGWEVHYLSTEPPAPDAVAAIGRFRFHRVPRPFRGLRLTWLVFLAVAIPWTFLLALRHRVDALVGWEMFGAIAVPTAWLLKLPLLTFKRGESRAFLASKKASAVEHRLYRLVEWLSLAGASRVFSVSEDLAARIVTQHGLRGPVEVLRNDARPQPGCTPEARASVRARLGADENARVIVAAGTFKPSKGMEVVVTALAALKDLAVQLVLLGEGPDRGRLTELARTLGVEGRVRFSGWVESPAPYYAASDAVVVPSIHDDCPNSLLEGLACGCVVLASRAGGIPEILEEPELMFEPGNATELAARLRAIFTDETLAQRLRRLCVERARRFDFDWGHEITTRIAAATSLHQTGASGRP